MKSSTSSCFYLADAVALTRSNDRLSQAAPTYPQSHAPSTFLQSCHKEDYVTVGSTQAISPTVTTLSLFPPVSCSGLKLFVKVSVFSTFSDLRCLLFSFDFFPLLFEEFYICWEKLSSTEQRKVWLLSSCWQERPTAAAAELRSKVKTNLLLVNALMQIVWRSRDVKCWLQQGCQLNR